MRPSAVRPTLRRAAALAALAVASVAPAALRAQETPPPPAAGRPATAGPYRFTLGGSPFLPIAGVVSGEWERAVGARGVSVGVGGLADFSGSEERFSSLQAKVKYYPNEVTLKGFAIGVTVGVLSAYDRESGFLCDFPGCVPIAERDRRDTKPTFGVVLDYNWLVGRQRRLLVGAGIGVRRVLGDVGGDSPLNEVWPDGRLVLGWAF